MMLLTLAAHDMEGLEAIGRLALGAVWGSTNVQYPHNVSGMRQLCDIELLHLLTYVATAVRRPLPCKSHALPCKSKRERGSLPCKSHALRCKFKRE